VVGLLTILHCFPSQCSINVRESTDVFEVLCPTAHTLFAANAMTAFRALFSPATFGLGTIFHFFPFHCSIRVVCRLLLSLLEEPTAQSCAVLGTTAAPKNVLTTPLVGPVTILHF